MWVDCFSCTHLTGKKWQKCSRIRLMVTALILPPVKTYATDWHHRAYARRDPEEKQNCSHINNITHYQQQERDYGCLSKPEEHRFLICSLAEFKRDPKQTNQSSFREMRPETRKNSQSNSESKTVFKHLKIILDKTKHFINFHISIFY